MRLRPSSLAFTTVLCSLLLSACATHPRQPQPGVSATEVENLRREQQGLDEQVGKLRDNLLLLEARVADQQDTLDRLRRELETRKEDSRQIAGPERPERAPAAPAATREAAGERPAAAETYMQAFADYAAGRYTEAVAGFARFLENFPENSYAGNARYWLGESHFRQQQYRRAIDEFRTLVDRYPDSNKAPDALLKQAQAYRELGDRSQAEDTLRRLRALYPDSSAARQSLQSP